MTPKLQGSLGGSRGQIPVVLMYIDKLVDHNEKANISGRTWRRMLVKGLPHELRKDLAKMQGGKPEEDDALIIAMNELGLAYWQFL